MSRYKVSVNENVYEIAVERLDDSCCKNIHEKHSSQILQNDYSVPAEISFQAVKEEYDYGLKRSEKLDNKIYIILTVFAFLFVLLCDNINGIRNFSFPGTQPQLTLQIVYFVILFVVVACYIGVLLMLTQLLKGLTIRRFKPHEVLTVNLAEKAPQVTAKFICERYIEAINKNAVLLENRFKKFNLCVLLLVPTVIGLLILVFLRILIL